MPSSLVRSWQLRLQELQAALAHEPNSARDWERRAQIKILQFLLKRYPDWPDSTPLAPPHSSLSITSVEGQSKPPRRALYFRAMLRDIERKNEGTPSPLIYRSWDDPGAFWHWFTTGISPLDPDD